jgi:hypothetical protein
MSDTTEHRSTECHGTRGGHEREHHKKPNSVLRSIREQERHETREEFARAFRKKAEELGERQVSCDAKLVARWERGDIRYPHPITRRILSSLLARPFDELGFASRGNHEEPGAEE